MNLYMMCDRVNPAAFSDLPAGTRLRDLRPDELDIWLEFPFDSKKEAEENRADMEAYYNRVYAPCEAAFYRACKVICDEADAPLATAFLWKSYEGRLHTLHWLKTRKDKEGRGLGKALLTLLLKDLKDSDYPLFLHTHPQCVAAISLYTDFGFDLLRGPAIGGRSNDLEEGLTYLKSEMRQDKFARLRFRDAPELIYEVTKGKPSEF